MTDERCTNAPEGRRKTSSPTSSERDPVEMFLKARTNGERVLIAFAVGVMLFAAGIMIGGAVGKLGF